MEQLAMQCLKTFVATVHNLSKEQKTELYYLLADAQTEARVSGLDAAAIFFDKAEDFLRNHK